MDDLDGKITFRAIIEVLGKPQEHVEKSLKGYVEKLKENEKYEVLKENIAPIKKRDEEELWAIFAELEISTNDPQNLINFCFEYMPSLIEVIEPKKLTLSDANLTMFLNDIQAKLHQVDMIAKQVKMELDFTKKGMSSLLSNFLMVLLGNRKLTSDKLSTLTGMKKDILEDFLDKLIDDGRIELENDEYFLKKKVEA